MCDPCAQLALNPPRSKAAMDSAFGRSDDPLVEQGRRILSTRLSKFMVRQFTAKELRELARRRLNARVLSTFTVDQLEQELSKFMLQGRAAGVASCFGSDSQPAGKTPLVPAWHRMHAWDVSSKAPPWAGKWHGCSHATMHAELCLLLSNLHARACHHTCP